MSLREFERIIWIRGNRRIEEVKMQHKAALTRLAISTSDIINMIGVTQIKDYKPVSAKKLLDRWENKQPDIDDLKARMKAADERNDARLARERKRG